MARDSNSLFGAWASSARRVLRTFVGYVAASTLTLLALQCRADDTFVIDGPSALGSAIDYSFPDHAVYVGSLDVRVNGSPITAMCVTIDRVSTIGIAWGAQTFSLGGDLSGFGLYDGTDARFRALQEAAFLFQQIQLSTVTSQIIAYQKAAWSLIYSASDPKYVSYLNDASTLPAVNAALALAHSQVFTSAFNNSVYYYAPASPTDRDQIFVAVVPEASPLSYLGAALSLFLAVQFMTRMYVKYRGDNSADVRKRRVTGLRFVADRAGRVTKRVSLS